MTTTPVSLGGRYQQANDFLGNCRKGGKQTMNNVGVTGTKTIRTSGWVLVFAVGLLQTVSAVFLLAFSGPSTFEADTGVSWAALSEQFPTVADQFSMVQQASLVGTLALGLISLAVTFFALRNGQRWPTIGRAVPRRYPTATLRPGRPTPRRGSRRAHSPSPRPRSKRP